MPPFLLICFFPSRFADREVDRHDETFVQRPVGAEYGCADLLEALAGAQLGG